MSVIFLGSMATSMPKRQLAFTLLGLFGILFFCSVLYAVRDWETRHARSGFEKAARDRRELLQRAINNNIEVLYSIGALFNASQTVNRNEFRTFVMDALARHAEIHAVRWQPLVQEARRETFENANRGEDNRHFAIHRLDRSGHSQPPAAERVYFPVQFIEPQDGNERWLGLDDPIGAIAREAAQNIRPPASLIVSEHDHPWFKTEQDLITLYLPVFAHNRPSARGKIAGFAALALNLHELILNSLANFRMPPIAVTTANQTELRPHIHLTDSGAANEPGFFDRLWPGEKSEKLEWQSELNVAAFRIPIIFTSRPNYFQTSQPWGLWLAAAAGLLYFSLSGGYLWASEKNRLQKVRLVRKLMSESKARAAASAQLLANETRLQQLNAELEARIGERTVKLRELNQNLESFVYSVSHDLKAPLRGIEGYSRLLLEDYSACLSEEARGFLNNIRTATVRMNQIIDDLLAYSRLERQALTIALFPLKPILNRILAERELEIQTLAAEVRLEIDDIQVKADAGALLLALRNLIDNALKFSNKTGLPVITVRAAAADAAALISIADNGCGFDMKYHDRIFEIFQRLHRIEDYDGTGIGLTIVRKAAERMHGRVWAESEPGRGATFYLELPT